MRHRLVDDLGLAAHPEGGFFRRVHCSALAVVPADGRGQRPAQTAILYLLEARSSSRWHQVRSDEIWTHQEGGPLRIRTFDEGTGEATERILAPRPDGVPFFVVSAGRWQAAEPVGEAVLVLCAVGPGFDFADFRLAADEPATAARIRRLGADAARLV